MSHLMGLRFVTQVTMPRAGSEYLQSLYDGNDEVLIFPTNFRFFTEYVPKSETINKLTSSIRDIASEFVSKEFHRLHTKNFKSENLNKLGKNSTDSIKVPVEKFNENFLNLLKNSTLTPKNILLALYGSFHKSIGRDIFSLKVLWHHAHYFKEAIEFSKAYPNVKLIINIRNPLASFYSIQKSYKVKAFNDFRYSLVRTIMSNLDEWSSGKNNKIIRNNFEDSYFVRLEDIPRKDIMQKISRFIGVLDSPINYVSTWCGYEWKGDSVSWREYRADEKWSLSRSYNGWKEGLTNREKLLITFLFSNFMQKNCYIQNEKCNKGFFQFLLLFSTLFFPVKTEREFYKINYYVKKVRQYKKSKPIKLIVLYLFSEFFYYFVIRWQILTLFLKIPRKKLNYRK